MRTPVAIALWLLLCAWTFRAQAQGVAEFYKGRTVTVVVSSSAAGGYDTVARSVARHIGRHLPGAGGMTATRRQLNVP